MSVCASTKEQAKTLLQQGSERAKRGIKKCLGEHFPQLEVIIKTAGAVFTALLLGLHFVCQADSRATPAVNYDVFVHVRMQECNPVPYLVPVSNLADLPHVQVFIIDGSPGCLL